MSKHGATEMKSSPWEPQQQYMKDVWSQAQDLYGTPIQQYGPSTVGPQSAMTQEGQQAGLGLIRGAGQGSQFGYLNNVMSGQYLNPETNPYLQSMYDQGVVNITRDFKTAAYPGASMGAIGRVGSGAEMRQQGLAYRGLGDALSANYANTFGRNYEIERGYMQQAPGMMNQAQAGQRADIGLGTQLGGQADQYAQMQLNDLIQKFNFVQQEPGQRLDAYQQRIFGGGVIPGTQTLPGGQGFGAAQGIGTALGVMGTLMSMFPATAPAGIALTAGSQFASGTGYAGGY